MIRFSALTLTAAAVCVGGIADAQARVILNFTIPGVFTSPNFGTPSPNNDNVASGNPNTISLPGFPGPGLPFSSLAPIDTVFAVQPSGGATEYFVSDVVVNNTGFTWSGFKLQIGTGTGAGFALGGGAVIPEIIMPDFDIPTRDPFPTASAFSQAASNFFELEYSNGLLGPGATSFLNMTFSLDTPDDISVNGYTSFTLRQFPLAVPEPASAILLATGIIGLLFAVRGIRE
jgi:hypothetical protein